MEKVNLIPPVLPVPKVLKKDVATPTKEQSMKEKYNVTNTDDPNDKHPAVQELWSILEKMDPQDDIWTSEASLLSIKGDIIEGRKPTDLGFSPREVRLVESVSILDCTKADENDKSIASSAVGSITTIYQLIELAYNMGKKDEISRVLSLDDDDDGVEDELIDDDEEDYDGDIESINEDDDMEYGE